jgi:hypothetical protein
MWYFSSRPFRCISFKLQLVVVKPVLQLLLLADQFSKLVCIIYSL